MRNMAKFEKNSKIFVSGHTGMLGSALVKLLQKRGCSRILLKKSSELDLRRQSEVEAFFRRERPEYVFAVAARVGGIQANMARPAEFIYDNLLIESNIIHSAHEGNVKKLLFVSSSCSYPRLCNQPMREEDLLTGKPEDTNEGYAIAKISGMKLAEAYHRQYGASFFSVIFPNLYGPGDNFDPESSHVISALIRKICTAKANRSPEVDVWGSGKQRREFLYTEDAADACVFLMNRLNGGEAVNAGAGGDISIRKLAYLIKKLVGYEGRLVFQADKPDGMPRKLIANTAENQYGWRPKTDLERGLKKTIAWYRKFVQKPEHP
jgi:GDP-L-fucose synthase